MEWPQLSVIFVEPVLPHPLLASGSLGFSIKGNTLPQISWSMINWTLPLIEISQILWLLRPFSLNYLVINSMIVPEGTYICALWGAFRDRYRQSRGTISSDSWVIYWQFTDKGSRIYIPSNRIRTFPDVTQWSAMDHAAGKSAVVGDSVGSKSEHSGENMYNWFWNFDGITKISIWAQKYWKDLTTFGINSFWCEEIRLKNTGNRLFSTKRKITKIVCTRGSGVIPQNTSNGLFSM